MGKYVHIWEVKCTNRGDRFQHVFVASDILEPHISRSILLKCTKRGSANFDPVKMLCREPVETYETEHPGELIQSLPEHS